MPESMKLDVDHKPSRQSILHLRTHINAERNTCKLIWNAPHKNMILSKGGQGYYFHILCALVGCSAKARTRTLPFSPIFKPLETCSILKASTDSKYGKVQKSKKA